MQLSGTIARVVHLFYFDVQNEVLQICLQSKLRVEGPSGRSPSSQGSIIADCSDYSTVHEAEVSVFKVRGQVLMNHVPDLIVITPRSTRTQFASYTSEGDLRGSFLYCWKSKSVAKFHRTWPSWQAIPNSKAVWKQGCVRKLRSLQSSWKKSVTWKASYRKTWEH